MPSPLSVFYRLTRMYPLQSCPQTFHKQTNGPSVMTFPSKMLVLKLSSIITQPAITDKCSHPVSSFLIQLYLHILSSYLFQGGVTEVQISLCTIHISCFSNAVYATPCFSDQGHACALAIATKVSSPITWGSDQFHPLLSSRMLTRLYNT